MTMLMRTSDKPCIGTGIFVNQLRHLVELTQAQFAERLGVAIPTVVCWEHDRAQPLPFALMRLKAMLYELQDSPQKIQQKCAQVWLTEYFGEEL